MNKKISFYSKKSVLALAVASSLTLSPVLVEAAGLGKITVFSALGQPLRAEVQVNATQEELPGMTARLAPADYFRQSGVDYAPILLHLQFSTEKRSGGAVIKITSDKPINEPFLDFLLELNWPSGRLVREYTFLLDPVDMSPQAPPRVSTVDGRDIPALNLTPPVEKPAAPQPQITARVTPPPATTENTSQSTDIPGLPPPTQGIRKTPAAGPQAEKPVKKAEPAAPPPVAKEQAAEHLVRPGDTLHRIASSNRQEGVSLEQMLVALYRHNADAFSQNNMNRLRTGSVLRIPTQEEAAAIPEAEARKVFRAQARDWNAYRNSLASAAQAAPADQTGDNRSDSGRIAANVDEKASAPQQPKDQVKVSRSTQAGSKSGPSEEDLIAKEKALQEAQERVAQLESNVQKLEKLLEMKNQNLAQLEKQAAAQKGGKKSQETPAPAATATTATAPAVEPASGSSTSSATVEEKSEEKVLSAETTSAAPEGVDAAGTQESEPKEVQEGTSEEATAPAEPPPVPAPPPPKKPVPPPPIEVLPVEEPSFLDSLGMLPVIGGALALLAGGGFLVYRRRRSAAQNLDSEVSESAPSSVISSTLGPNSVFQTAGGQSVDTSQTSPPPATEFSLAGSSAIDTHEVDPVHEADVYIAYGRDTQAEEILLDALQKEPQRVAIHTKLLEIYALRKSVKQFETLASEVYSLTSGTGADWEKVVALGQELDPSNPLYGGKANPQQAKPEISSPAAMASAPVMAAPAAAMAVADNKEDVLDLEEPLFELPEQSTPPAKAATPSPATPGPAASAEPLPELTITSVPAAPETRPLADIESPLEFSYESKPKATAPAATAPSPDLSATLLNPDADLGNTLDFEFELDSTPETPKANQQQAQFAGGDLQATTVVPSPDFLDLPAAPEAPEAALSISDLKFPGTEELAAAHQSAAEDEMEFDMNFTASTVLGNVAPSDFDLSSIDLDLGDAPAATAAGAEAGDVRRDEVNTKLDLAKAYEDMGDVEGAAELLKEIVEEGAPDQIEAARNALTRLGV